MARTCGAKVKGISPRSSGRTGATSVLCVPEDVLADVGWSDACAVSVAPLFPELDDWTKRKKRINSSSCSYELWMRCRHIVRLTV